ncbi:MAG: spore maturation protein A [Oscillospiraceae bacterium]|nr:spore maturation protein A [Oscillospiraceae bacterium]
MVMSRIWSALVLISFVFSLFTGQGSALAAAVMEGAQSGVTLAISLAGALCLWTGVARVMERVGLTGLLAKGFSPVLNRIFPSCRLDAALAGDLSANVCANLLGLGNAATPMGISAARRLARGNTATDELCRLVVLNTASIQLIPANVAAVRTSLGCAAPFDILTCVWITSFTSAGVGLAAAWVLGKLWIHE